MKTPREYQNKAVDAIFKYFELAEGNPLIVAPTGSGKSLIMAEFIRRAIDMYDGTVIQVLSHVKELLVQDEGALIEQAPTVQTGFYCAGLDRRDLSKQVTFCSIQSVYKRANMFRQPHLILVDEAHLINPNTAGMYRQYLEAMKALDPMIKIVGFTATPFRADSGMLTDGDDALFSEIAFDIPVSFLVDEGYLSPVVTPDEDVEEHLDTTGVGMRGGDFIQSELAAAVDRDDLTRKCVDDILRHGADRKSWLVFACSIAHAEHVEQVLRLRGIDTAIVTGETPKVERARILDDYKAGHIRCIVNVGVLTTGFDAPATDMVVLMRPTRSPVLYVQIIGRGMRLAEGKENCLVLDFGGVIDALGPIDGIRIPRKTPSKGEGEAPEIDSTKQCPSCFTVVGRTDLFCPECGENLLNIDSIADRAKQIIAGDNSAEWFTVTSLLAQRHTKVGKPDSVKVTYFCGRQKISEWICLDHGGFAAMKAQEWVADMVDGNPTTTDELLRCGTIRTPTNILCTRNGPYWTVKLREGETK